MRTHVWIPGIQNLYYNGCTYNILEDYVAGATFGTFQVTCISINEIAGVSIKVIHYEVINREAINFPEYIFE